MPTAPAAACLSSEALTECAAHIAARIAELDAKIDDLCFRCDEYERAGFTDAVKRTDAKIEALTLQLKALQAAV